MNQRIRFYIGVMAALAIISLLFIGFIAKPGLVVELNQLGQPWWGLTVFGIAAGGTALVVAVAWGLNGKPPEFLDGDEA